MRRVPRILFPPVEEAYLSVDGLFAAAASVVVALVQRQWPDEEKRDLEVERMRLENEKIRAEIQVLKSVEVVVEEDEAEAEPTREPKRRKR